MFKSNGGTQIVGQKISAYALRLGINQAWKSHYFPPKKGQAN